MFKQCCEKLGIDDLSNASIREIVECIKELQNKTSASFIRMDMGVPGLPAPSLAVDAEIDALNRGVASKYAQIDGIPELKKEISVFAKNFIDIDVDAENCMVTTGSMQGSMVSLMIAGRRFGSNSKILFIDPGFPVQKRQAHALGLDYVTFDIYDFRGEKLEQKLLEVCRENDISAMIYSSPNNPAWYSLTNKELAIIGSIATAFRIVVIEDLAYFGMDFRKDYSVPRQEPYQPSVANFTDNYILLISSSKMFSYAGQRVAAMLISNNLANSHFPALTEFCNSTRFGKAMVMDGIYVLSAGVCHSAQYGLLALLKAANSGKLNISEDAHEYGIRAKKAKKIFIENGFELVYAFDGNEPIADGFFFTVKYKKMNSSEIISEMMKFGMSTVSLNIMGSKKKGGIRVSVSQLDDASLLTLERRLRMFQNKQSY